MPLPTRSSPRVSPAREDDFAASVEVFFAEEHVMV